MTPVRPLAVLALAGAGLFACKSSSEPPTPVPTSITLSATSVDLSALGATATVTATVKDQNGTAMSGQAVTWGSTNASVATVTGGATGTITAVANGTTSVTATSGSITSSAVTVSVTQVTASLAKISGDNQTGQVGAQLAQPVVVEQRDSRGNVVPGGTGGLIANSVVNFAVATGGGSIATASATVGPDGRASTTWTLGGPAGQQTVTATTGVISTGTVTFTATGTAGSADSLVIVSGNGQTGTVDAPLLDSLVVRVADAFGNPVSGHQVTFAATSGGGSVSPGTVATGSNGQAATRWTLGSSPGGQTAEAQAASAITGSPATFNATASTLAITAIAPDTMVEGGSVTITGTGFDASPANNTVMIGGVAGTVTLASATSLSVTVPTYNCQPVRAVNVTVTVGAATSLPASHPVKPASLLNLAVGDQQVIRDPAAFCLQFAASASGGDGYLIGVGAAAETPATAYPFLLTSIAGASPAPPAAIATLLRTPVVSRDIVRPSEEAVAWARQYRAEARIRDMERTLLPTLGRPLPDRSPGSAAAAPARSLASMAVGDTVAFRIPDISKVDACANFKAVTTVVRAVGTAGIWYTDINNPTADSLTTAQIQAYSDTFDVHIYARDTLYFGKPSDIDANSRVEIVLSIEVNKFTLGVAGFVFGGDLFSRGSCASSDSSEVFYGHVPDPTNAAGTGARTKANILYQMPSLIAHEFTHNIQQSRRLVLLGGGFMASWEAEGQAMLAQEVVGHSVLGNSPGQNYTRTTALQGQGDRWYGQGFDLLSYYFGKDPQGGKATAAPEMCSLFATTLIATNCDPFHYYGASWTFQRYVADRFGPSYPGGEAALNRAVISLNPTMSGVAAWEALLGMSMDTVEARWAAMLYGDDRVSGLTPAATMSSWNLFDIMNAYPSDDYRLVPLARQFTAFADSRSVRGGSTAYTTVTSAGSRSALAIRVRDAIDGTLGSAMKPLLWIVRTQ